jgi:competence protein ComEC
LAAIWSFTMLTGATASVLRASVMFSLYLAGRALHREASIWNVLASSAFGLLLYNPYFLFDAGFQLSYAAVAGMVFFYPRLYRISPLLPRWADEGWKVLLVGLSAQIGTLPLSLYYFHQFPVYFWLAGWVVVLGGALFLWGGAALVALDALWPVAAGLLGKGLYGMVWAMNWIILAIQRLPGAVVSGIWLPAWAAGLLYLGLVCFAAAWAWRNGRYLTAALVILLALGVCRAIRSVDRAGQHAVIAYAAGKVRLLDFVSGETAVSLQDSLSPRQIQFTAQANRWALGVRNVRSHPLEADTLIKAGAWAYFPPAIQFAGYRIALIDHHRQLESEGPPQPVHTLILSGSPRLELAACLERFPASLVVFDATNRPHQVERWRAECQALNLPFHDIRAQGAWTHHW